MKFALNKPVKIVMIGAGGTGSHISPHLYRLLHTLDRPVRVIICDGDVVEEKNLIRQGFIRPDLGRIKSQVLAERYASAFGLEVEYVPNYIESEDRLMELITPDTYLIEPYSYQRAEGLSILIGAVDNNRSRQLCHRIFGKASDLIYIDSGNGEHTGQVVCGIRRKGRTYYKPIGDIYPDVLEDTDVFPSELSCADAAHSAPQSIVANIMAATAVVSYLFNILVLGSIETKSIVFSSKTINIKPTVTQKRVRKKNKGVEAMSSYVV